MCVCVRVWEREEENARKERRNKQTKKERERGRESALILAFISEANYHSSNRLILNPLTTQSNSTSIGFKNLQKKGFYNFMILIPALAFSSAK